MIQKINEIVILGGGSAGWLTALYLKKIFPDNNYTLIEDPSTPPIIAGESSAAILTSFYNFLEIDQTDWAIKTHALPKLGSKFIDWNGVGTNFIHGLISDQYRTAYDSNFLSTFNLNRDFISCALAENIKMENIFYCSEMIKQDKLPIIQKSNNTFEALHRFMWHFNSRENAAYLKNLGQQRGIKLIEKKYVKSNLDALGNISSVTVDGATNIVGDWFFDCSGFSRLLLQKTLGVTSTDYSNLFPARSVVAWWDRDTTLVNYTTVTAMKYGWSWRINLDDRTGNGYVFDPDHITLDQAVEEIKNKFNTDIVPVANLNFTPSLVKEYWKNNVIAIGISSGFLEPLESNGLGQVITQLILLEKFWNPTETGPIDQKLYNSEVTNQMKEIINFLSLHYKGHRRDTDFWKSHSFDSNRTNDYLKEKIEQWNEGILVDNDLTVYPFESYATVIQGLDLINLDKLKKRLCTRPNIFENFYKSYNNTMLEKQKIIDQSLDLKTWYRFMFNKHI
jgi:tryptophan 7-halogenase